jgi:hypothetical protein
MMSDTERLEDIKRDLISIVERMNNPRPIDKAGLGINAGQTVAGTLTIYHESEINSQESFSSMISLTQKLNYWFMHINPAVKRYEPVRIEIDIKPKPKETTATDECNPD